MLYLCLFVHSILGLLLTPLGRYASYEIDPQPYPCGITRSNLVYKLCSICAYLCTQFPLSNLYSAEVIKETIDSPEDMPALPIHIRAPKLGINIVLNLYLFVHPILQFVLTSLLSYTPLEFYPQPYPCGITRI